MGERAAFLAELRRARERRGLTLDDLAEQTKVSAAHFAGLERADLSRWPSGIFRRAFVRSYSAAIGLDPDEVLSRFNILFPDPSEDPKAAARAEAAARLEISAPEQAEAPAESEANWPGLRLALDQVKPFEAAPSRPSTDWLAAAAIDVSLALLPATLAGLVGGASWFWATAACVALAGHFAFHVVKGATPGGLLLTRRVAAASAVPVVRAERRRPEPEPAPTPRRRVSRHATSRSAAHVHRVRH